MTKIELLEVNLSLFDGAAAAGGDGAAPAETSSAKGETQATVPGRTRRGKSGEYSNVLFGTQPTAETAEVVEAPSSDAGSDKKSGVETTSNTLEDRRKAYRELVNSEEYKDIYTEDTQRIINRRFTETRNLQQRVDQYQPVIDMLMQRYNISGDDVGKLANAIENDNAIWADEAEEAGMSVEQYKKFKKLERENAALREAEDKQQQKQKAQEQMRTWFAEAESLKATYPDFDMQTECENPEFVKMLRNGIPVEHAYTVLHMDEIKAGIARNVAATTEKQVVDGIRAKGARPAENGTASQSAFIVKDDVSKLTKRDRAEAIRRASMGESITFGAR